MNLKKYIILTMVLTLNMIFGSSSWGFQDEGPIFNFKPSYSFLDELGVYSCQTVSFTLTPEGKATFVEHSSPDIQVLNISEFKKKFSEDQGTLTIANEEEGGSIYVTAETFNQIGLDPRKVITDPIVIPEALHCHLEVVEMPILPKDKSLPSFNIKSLERFNEILNQLGKGCDKIDLNDCFK